jgi:predicted ester cyclase
VVGLEACLNHFAVYRKAIPDQHWTVEDQIAEGDKVVVLWTLRGTHAGELMGIPPTGRELTMTGISVFRIAGGKLIEDWVQSDTLGLFQQLGAFPTSTKAAS